MGTLIKLGQQASIELNLEKLIISRRRMPIKIAEQGKANECRLSSATTTKQVATLPTLVIKGLSDNSKSFLNAAKSFSESRQKDKQL
jgi:hypothetical protein